MAIDLLVVEMFEYDMYEYNLQLLFRMHTGINK